MPIGLRVGLTIPRPFDESDRAANQRESRERCLKFAETGWGGQREREGERSCLAKAIRFRERGFQPFQEISIIVDRGLLKKKKLAQLMDARTRADNFQQRREIIKPRSDDFAVDDFDSERYLYAPRGVVPSPPPPRPPRIIIIKQMVK